MSRFQVSLVITLTVVILAALVSVCVTNRYPSGYLVSISLIVLSVATALFWLWSDPKVAPRSPRNLVINNSRPTLPKEMSE